MPEVEHQLDPKFKIISIPLLAPGNFSGVKCETTFWALRILKFSKKWRHFEDLYTPAIQVQTFQTLPLEGQMILRGGVHPPEK